jgi:hypothetical protein
MTAYNVVHTRLRRTRGIARDLPCVECGGGPCWWALQYNHSESITQPENGSPYSTDLDDYAPMCQKCHGEQDRANSERKRNGVKAAQAAHQRMLKEDPTYRARWYAASTKRYRERSS